MSTVTVLVVAGGLLAYVVLTALLTAVFLSRARRGGRTASPVRPEPPEAARVPSVPRQRPPLLIRRPPGG